MGDRIAHKITRGKNNERQQNVIYMDSESWVDKEGGYTHTPYLVCANFCRYKSRKTDYWKDYLYDGYKEFWNDACKFTSFKTTTFIYAHNMGYDILAIAGIPCLEVNNFRLKSFFEKGGTMIYRFIYEEKDGDGIIIDGKTKTIVLLSTTNFYADKLANLAKVFNLSKGLDGEEYEFNGMTEEQAIKLGWTMEKGIKYCRQDVNIIKVAMEHLFKFIESEDLGAMGKTAASQAFNAFRHKFMNHDIYIHTNKNAIKLERAAYYGGRVECFRIGELKDDTFYYVDVNSMYPYVMQELTYPVKLLSFCKRNTLEDIKDAINNGHGVIAEVKIKTNTPYFPLRKWNKLIFPVGEFWTYLATPELKFAIEHNLIVDIKECSYYEMANLFEEYVRYFYGKRLKSKAEKNEVFTYFYKLLLNCLYGKFGQISENWEIVGDIPFGIAKHETVLNHDTGEQMEIKKLCGTLFKKLPPDEAFNSFCAIAAHVTSAARIHLLNHILIADFENCYYCDTDSIFTNSDGYEKLLPYLDNKELGKMKIEMVGDKLKINAPKDYYFRTTEIIKKEDDKYTLNEKGEKVYYLEKRKGISKDARQLTLKEFCEYIEAQRSKLSKKDFIEFINTVKKEELTVNMQWAKMNTFINKGDVGRFYNIMRIKKLSRKYNKGIVLKNGKVIPFEINN